MSKGLSRRRFLPAVGRIGASAVLSSCDGEGRQKQQPANETDCSGTPRRVAARARNGATGDDANSSPGQAANRKPDTRCPPCGGQRSLDRAGQANRADLGAAALGVWLAGRAGCRIGKRDTVHLASHSDGPRGAGRNDPGPGAPELAFSLSARGPLDDPLAYPFPFVSERGTSLVVPMNEGISYPVRRPAPIDPSG